MLVWHSDLVLDCQPDVPRSKSHCDTGPNFLIVGNFSLSLEKAFHANMANSHFRVFHKYITLTIMPILASETLLCENKKIQ